MGGCAGGAYGPITLDPASSVLHYASEVFEGLKAYQHPDGGVYTFRPHANAARFNRSAVRMALPELPEETFVESLEELLAADKAWVPPGTGSPSTCVPSCSAPTSSWASAPPRRSATG